MRDDHFCDVCSRSMFDHDPQCRCDACDAAGTGEFGYFTPPLCCPGCACGSFERAHAERR